MQWLVTNSEWVFSGIGITFAGVAYRLFFQGKNSSAQAFPSIVVQNTNTSTSSIRAPANADHQTAKQSVVDLKKATRILFVDDDGKFQVVNILKNAGWPHVKIVKTLLRWTALKC